MPFEEIAERLGVELKTIQYYAELYFDVADRRTCDIWIQKVVRGDFDPNRTAGTPNSDDAARGYLLRFLAVYGGRHVLDSALHGLGLASLPRSSEEVGGWLDEALRATTRTRALLAALTMQVDQKNAFRLIKLAPTATFIAGGQLERRSRSESARAR